MITILEKKIAFRYLFTKKKDGFINIVSIFSFLGIALGVAVLIVVMSVMNGFRTELINKINGFNSHLKISADAAGKIDLKNLNNKKIREISKNFFLSNSGESVIIHNTYTKGIILRGYLKDDFKKDPAPNSCLKLPPLSIDAGSVIIFIVPPTDGAARFTALNPR